MRLQNWIVLILPTLIFYAGCASVPENPDTSDQKVRLQLIADYNNQTRKVIDFEEGGEGFEPPSYRKSVCYPQSFERYIFTKPDDPDAHGFESAAYYCPVEARYWLNQSGGVVAFFNRWSGPFEFRPTYSEKH